MLASARVDLIRLAIGGSLIDGGRRVGAVWRPPPGKRGAFLLGRLLDSAGAGLRVRRLGRNRAGEIRLTRLLRNKKVTPEAMVAQAAAQTAERCARRDVLAIQDTTVVRSQGGGGLYLHPVLVADLQSGAILGLAHAEFLQRDQGQAAQRRQRPVEHKQSARWLDGATQAGLVCASARQITVVADRECDIYAAFARQPDNVMLLIRAAHDRALEDDGRLFACLDALPVAGRAELSIPAAPGRRARTTEITARLTTTRLRRPRNGIAENLPEWVEVTAVDIREIDPPPPGQAAVHWRLLTTRAVRDAAEAFALADLYRRRWCIEQLFRTLKTGGFDIEAIDIEDERPLRNLVMAALVAAVCVQQLVHARDGAQGQGGLRPLTDAFEAQDASLLQALCRELEGKTERQKNPHPVSSLAYGAWVCARLGGWTGYYGKPGPAVMFHGWKYFQAAKHGATLLNPHNV